ncbi:MAG: hypothetical protein M1838_000540 [Thelocarpon superellum]|nr:MAG: hypothetical protein M1838_000540 [Thelocarpon superellum]
MSNHPGGFPGERDGLQPPRVGPGGRSLSNSSMAFSARNPSLAVSAAPGSFSSDLRSTMSSRAATPRPDGASIFGAELGEEDGKTASERILAVLSEKLNREMKIKEGSENLLEALNTKKAKQTKEQRSKVELELNSSNRKIGQLQSQIEELRRPKEPATPPRARMSTLFRNSPSRASPTHMATVAHHQSDEEDEEETESPTYALAEILQSLEAEGLQPDYYVERSNNLVELFKRHPTLKYDLAWSVFGLRVQTMLLSESKEVVAAGYRVARYAITDRSSLQTIRNLNTDYLVTLSLVKEGKASVEREQALKFIRAFLDVKNGVKEVSRAVVRTMVAVAEHSEDRLRSICIETLAEILIRDPTLLLSAGGVGPLTEVLGDGTYEASPSLVMAFLFLLDMPGTRVFLRAGHGLEVVFSAFTDSLASRGSAEKIKANARVIAAMMKTWTGLMALSMYDFRAIRSLVASLQFPESQVRDTVLELLFEILRIKPPSWSSSFLAGRRLTTYGRVANLQSESSAHATPSSGEETNRQPSLIEHYLALVLAVFLESGLLETLLQLLDHNPEPVLKRKATLLLSEILKMASWMLPSTHNAKIQMLPQLFASASNFSADTRFLAANTVYQIDSVSRTLQRSGAGPLPPVRHIDGVDARDAPRPAEAKSKTSSQIDEAQFRTLMLDSQVLSTANYAKWRWDVLQEISEGPLLNPKRLDEAIKATKFLKRVVGFYRPFKYRFADVKNTKPNQRYVRIGCTLIHTLLQTPEGVKYLVENKLLRQLAECLAQLDHMSGLTSISPLFSATRLAETLSGGYFAILGVLGSDPKGLLMLERWKMINMCYHIIELDKRADLIKTLLGNMDFSLDSHFRVMLSKALTASTKDIRIFATLLLRKYATTFSPPSTTGPGTWGTSTSEWAIRLLVTQLYDPDVEVCETAVKILEEACNATSCLEYVVKCRPALDHLGEIGAPLLLRFLSTSTGYHYLNDLDYIEQEMDDWFLGRNDTYVTLVEASMARAFQTSERARREHDDAWEREAQGAAPPHFYRELTRTTEGCRLLKEKGHFDEFVATIADYHMDDDDAETIVKVKGCLWAVGNVGSMDLGAPFLEESDVVQSIVQIAEQAEVMTLRGTAFFALGLISQSLHGLEILDEYEWDGATTRMGLSLGLCIPLHLGRLFSIKPWSAKAELAHEVSSSHGGPGPEAERDSVNARILELVVDLGNTVLTKKAVSDLMHIKAKRPPGFREPRLFRKVMLALDGHHYRLPVRRFVIDLFEKSVMRRLVLDEESDEELTEAAVGPGDESS